MFSGSHFFERTTIMDYTTLSVPLNSTESLTYQFKEKDVYQLDCGTVLGTCKLLRSLNDDLKLYETGNYVPLVVDYDIWNRTQHFIWAWNLPGTLRTFKKQTIFILAPWHIYKNFSDSVWNKFSYLFLADLWLASSSSKCPKNPELRDLAFIWVTLWAIQRNRIIKDKIFRDDSLFGKLVAFCCIELVPMVG